MTVTATELAKDSNSVLDAVVRRGVIVEIQRHGHTVAEIRPKVGATREEMLRVLERFRWTEAESRELRAAMEAATEVFGYAGRD